MKGNRMQEGDRQGLRAQAVFPWQNPAGCGRRMRGQNCGNAASKDKFLKEAVKCIFTLTI